MALCSVPFIIFCIVLLLLYFAAPRRFQWIILLLASMVFNAFCGIGAIALLLVFALITYISTQAIGRIYAEGDAYIAANKETLPREERKKYKQALKGRAHRILIACVILLAGCLAFFKLVPIFEKPGLNLSVIAPLGVSYYTLQCIGYVTDVYRKEVTPERNYLKVLLFVSFFPQIVQGPISGWENLTGEIFASHEFDGKSFSYGFYRFLWGFFKKMVIADTMSPYIQDLFANYHDYHAPTLMIGAFLCMLRLYADFSGYMDIVCGLCQMMGISLTENFRQPFFSHSLTEFWTRWHISLGAWFRNYVFYPVGKSGMCKAMASKTRKKLGDPFADRLPMTFGLFAVWILIGLWHGINAPFVLWGILNGLIMIMTNWLDPVYGRLKKALRIDPNAAYWRAFTCIRTFILVSYLEVFSDVGTLKDGVGYILSSLTNTWAVRSLSDIVPYVNLGSPGEMHNLLVVIAGFAGVLAVSIRNEMLKKKDPGSDRDVRDDIIKLPILLQSVMLAGIFMLIVLIGVQSAVSNAGGFMYANF